MIPYRDNIHCQNTPWVTWSLIVVNMLVYVLESSLSGRELTRLYYVFGLVPARYFEPEWAEMVGLSGNDYTPVITSLFLHGNALHMVINMWMLWIFGDNVEDRMGPLRFICFYFLCGVVAGGLQVYFNTSSTVPMIGASGALAGVMGAYFFLYPYARIVIWVFMMPLFIQIPAIAFLGAWVIFQLYKATGGIITDTVYTDVAWWGHLGGFIAGVLTFRLFLIPGRGYRSNADLIH
jgi:membrane associated rhomboid family serine protease